MSGETVLVADDDASIRTVIDRALSGGGFKVRATPSAQTLWAWVVDGEGDVVVTDVVMPDGDGLDLLARIGEVRPEPSDRRDERPLHAADGRESDREGSVRVPPQAL